jgi:hypothetical protein
MEYLLTITKPFGPVTENSYYNIFEIKAGTDNRLRSIHTTIYFTPEGSTQSVLVKNYDTYITSGQTTSTTFKAPSSRGTLRFEAYAYDANHG